MTPQQICYVELLFSMIELKIPPKYMTDYMYNQACDVDMKVYLEWLLNRWVISRDNENHYPPTNNHKSLHRMINNV